MTDDRRLVYVEREDDDEEEEEISIDTDVSLPVFTRRNEHRHILNSIHLIIFKVNIGHVNIISEKNK